MINTLLSFDVRDDYRTLLENPTQLINFIKSMKTKEGLIISNSYMNSFLSVLENIIKFFCPNEENQKNIKEERDLLRKHIQLNQDEKNNETENIEDGKEIMENLIENHNDEYVYLIKKFGVMRPQELVTIKILDEDNDEDNYINIMTNKMIINKHKTFKTRGIKKIDLDDDFIKMVSNKLGGYLFQTFKGEKYKSVEGFEKMCVRVYGYKTYFFRKLKVSLEIHKILKEGGKMSEISKLENYNGHDFQTMLKHYRSHT